MLQLHSMLLSTEPFKISTMACGGRKTVRTLELVNSLGGSRERINVSTQKIEKSDHNELIP